MVNDARYLYTIFSKGPRGEILVGNVSAFNATDAVLEFATFYSTDPLCRYRNKREASNHLGALSAVYRAEMARKNGSAQGKPIRVKNLDELSIS